MKKNKITALRSPNCVQNWGEGQGRAEGSGQEEGRSHPGDSWKEWAALDQRGAFKKMRASLLLAQISGLPDKSQIARRRG